MAWFLRQDQEFLKSPGRGGRWGALDEPFPGAAEGEQVMVLGELGAPWGERETT